MRKVAVLIVGASLVSACADQSANYSGNWLKEGAGAEQRNRDSYECERDVRAAAGTYRRGSDDANEYFVRCMTAKGWAWRSDR